MATSRDDQSARVTKKEVNDVQCADTAKKDQQDGFSNHDLSKKRKEIVNVRRWNVCFFDTSKKTLSWSTSMFCCRMVHGQTQ